MSLARNLRNDATPEERALWQVLSALRPRFTRQLKRGSFVADFACRRARVMVELDGSQHVDSAADVRRTRSLERAGWRVVRFWNVDVQRNISGLVEAITMVVAERLPEGEDVIFVASRSGRERRPRTRIEKEPPLAPPRNRGGEQHG